MEGIFELLQKGGLAIYPLFFLSLLSWAVIVERLFSMRASNFTGKAVKDAKALLASKDIDGAIKLLSVDSSPVGNMLKVLIQSYKEGKLTRADLLREVDLELSLMLPKLEKNLALLSTVASTAPLIGLFGTITGLIKVFSAFAIANPEEAMSMLSMGIGEALVAAAVGLAVAIPALLAYWLFKIWGNSIMAKIEEEVFDLLRLL
ncbi:MAG: MotA/TolQ/ExbB proton channel family protein [Acidobacteria bacterium]|jgi:biopolymer transport protein ExbB|nr:MAG: MotA/TolQ/ExbB proton channel family protein [Acidobacteriota bacterium]